MELRAEDQDRAERILLQMADLPGEGWAVEPEDEEDDDDDSLPDLLQLNFSDLTVTGEAESPTFARGLAARVVHFVRVAESEADAAATFERISGSDLVSTLSVFFEEAAEEEAEVTDVSGGSAPFPTFGDESALIRVEITIEAEGLSIAVFFEIALVRVERAVSVFLFSDVLTPLPAEEKEALVGLVAERMAPQALPERTRRSRIAAGRPRFCVCGVTGWGDRDQTGGGSGTGLFVSKHRRSSSAHVGLCLE